MISSTAVMAFEWTILVFAYFLVACRVYVRMFLRGVGLHAADYWLIVGLVSCQGLLICDTLTFRMHAMDDFVLANNSIPIKKIRFATNYFFDTGIYFPKFSIIAFYFNLVPVTNPTMRRALFGLTGITVAFALITVFCDTFWCGPDPSVNWAEGEQTCTVFTSMTLMRLNWALNFITEVLNLVFPIPLLQGLMTSTRKKIGLAVVFGMGMITIAVSIGRFVTMLHVHNDISIYIWATAEICISVMIVALTALRPLLRKMTNSVSTSSDDRSGNPSRKTGLTRSSVYWPGGNKIPRRHVVEVGSESLAGSETELNTMNKGIMMTKQVSVSVGNAESDVGSSRSQIFN
ncbi:hypothetical protein FPSE_03845 [Fusarium pseudograminearum CS3096]|uniref:Rhodopsin domain-containing protein n=1 Tax=Fusarium pseudograminearum (strain CS3096) TaxID=1028729 RepID=K3VQB4_FUSPC|nr:hypothetical protein FPSE_03845 [Fusarium pseudograminearum CS3096]EKJ76073.1 hypothetical protein FPSE_03845 [Fusarium pseudograminearum CS3096]KAF0645881.1 hypothetical protein FPSE5266_03845 [Fusarium pseudograminearum]